MDYYHRTHIAWNEILKSHCTNSDIPVPQHANDLWKSFFSIKSLKKCKIKKLREIFNFIVKADPGLCLRQMELYLKDCGGINFSIAIKQTGQSVFVGEGKKKI